MKTYVFVYNNGQQLVFSAPCGTLLAVALNEARDRMPKSASKFRMAENGHFVSGWIN